MRRIIAVAAILSGLLMAAPALALSTCVHQASGWNCGQRCVCGSPVNGCTDSIDAQSCSGTRSYDTCPAQCLIGSGPAAVAWSQITPATFPANCSSGQFVTGLGSNLSCAAPAATTSLSWAGLTNFPAGCPGGQFVTAVGGSLTCAAPPVGGGGTVSGGGTGPRLAKWSTSNTLTDAANLMDDGTTVTIGSFGTQTNMYTPFDVMGGSGTAYTTAPIEIRTTATPRLAFHWPGVVASQIGMDSAGVIRTYNNPGTGYENFAAASITANGAVNVKDGNNDSIVIGEGGGGSGRIDFMLNGPNAQNLLFWGGNSGNSYRMTDFSVQANTVNFSTTALNASTVIYAPNVKSDLFVDNSNAAYYMNPDGNTVLRTIYNEQSILNRISLGTGQAVWGGWNEVLNFSSASHAAMTLPSGGLLFGLHSNRSFYWADTTNGYYSMWLTAGGDLATRNSLTSPVYYDGNDASYYADPNGVSMFNDIRPNIIYDKQNTGYYVDPNSTSNTYRMDAAYFHNSSDSWFPYTNGWNYFRGNTYAFNGVWYDENNTGYYVDPASTSVFSILYTQGIYDANDSSYNVDPNGVSRLNDIRPNIMYDGQNTAYYVDPNNVTNLNYLQTTNGSWLPYVNGYNYIRGNTYAFNGVWWDENNSNYLLDLNNTSTVNTLRYYSLVNLSDQRVKKDVTEYTDGLEVVRKLRPVSYVYNGLASTQEGKESIGLIAQEMQRVLPQLVSIDKLEPEEAKRSGVDTLLQIEPMPLIYVALSAIKTLDATSLKIDATGSVVVNGDVSAPNNAWGQGSGWQDCPVDGECSCHDGSYVAKIKDRGQQIYCHQL